MTEKKKYDSTVARIAGNLASNMFSQVRPDTDLGLIAKNAVKLARFIVEETERTEPV